MTRSVECRSTRDSQCRRIHRLRRQEKRCNNDERKRSELDQGDLLLHISHTEILIIPIVGKQKNI